ncbi:zf-HC2 domain-containing protein [Paraburkholderia sp. PREW-6R]|uniref:zf-HC2 domain-containing protein n=1 Tax=Paraburkholderia sp. PREW-6R TaxID=3141544 RepID=UPI0031F51F4E
MDCNEARPLLDANADHELPAPDARRVQQHIEGCDACKRESESLRALSGVLRTAPYHRASQSLRERIVAGLPSVEMAGSVVGDAAPEDARGGGNTSGAFSGSADGVPRTSGNAGKALARPWRWAEWLAALFDSAGGRGRGVGGGGGASGAHGGRAGRGGGGGGGGGGIWGNLGGPLAAGNAGRLFASASLAALVVVLCAVTAAVTMSLRPSASVSPFTDELVESHVRAQVSGRSIDVISTDRHTVKPWFNGKLDYTPPVEDLAANGFPLEGGRLDYLAHQRVAVLVYRYQKHVIDVYVFPQPRAGGAVPAGAATSGPDGYSIAHWNAEGMTWWAITDAAPDTLKGLEAALRARLQGGSERTEKGS